MANNGLYFQVLKGSTCFRIANALYWIPILTLLVGIALFTVIKGKSNKHHKKEDQNKDQPQEEEKTPLKDQGKEQW